MASFAARYDYSRWDEFYRVFRPNRGAAAGESAGTGGVCLGKGGGEEIFLLSVVHCILIHVAFNLQAFVRNTMCV